MNLDFICLRKHLFKDTLYQIDIQNEQLRLINTTSGKPKYIIRLDWSLEITWNITSQQQAFGLKVNQKFKWFHAKPQIIQNLKKQLQKYVTSTDFNMFYTLTTHQSKEQNNEYEVLKKSDNTANLVARCIQKDQIDDQNIIYGELNILKLLNHQGLPVFEEFFFTSGTYYIIMEKVQGEKLSTIVNTSKLQLNLRLIQSIIIECLQILQYLESINVMHRDITPDNLLYEQQNKKKGVKLINFSNAAKLGTEPKKCGTPGYIAPEIFLDQQYGCECDMFSLGCVFYKLLAKKDLFQGTSVVDVLSENKKCVINLKTLQLIRIPQIAQDLLNQMLETNPKLRISVQDALKHPFINDPLKPNASNQNSQKNFNQNRSERYLIKKELQSLHSQKQKLDEDLDVDYFNNELPPKCEIPVMNSVKGGQRFRSDCIEEIDTKFRRVVSKSTG
ncbi:unnamed protein product [Paramecium primaurelia]|uniref:Protein kinase domain-containing protein n=1 Tax=Paramecium primaurelia TaxID=5886 RepID=A0A8S1KB56_PARPR|nr:unnamed protein product [Paramecium primaurelia]